MAKRSLTPGNEAIAVARYAAGESAEAVGSDYGVSCNTVIRAVQRAGLPVRKRKDYHLPRVLAPGQEDQIVREYLAGEPVRSLAARYGVTHQTILAVLRRRKIRRRSTSVACRIYALDEGAFDPDPAAGVLRPEQLYWIGFLLADGNTYRDPRYPTSAKMQVGLQVGDRPQLEALRSFLKSEHPIKDVSGRPSILNGRVICSPSVWLRVSSARLVASLIRHGVVPAKTPTAAAVPHVLASPDVAWFWRGVIDGDGTLCYYTYPQYVYPAIGLTSALPLVEQFAAYARTITPGCEAEPRPGHGCWQWHTTGAHAVRLARALYGEPGWALPRKLALARGFASWGEKKEAEGRLAEEKRAARYFCTVEGCGRKAAALGLCPMHWKRQHLYGRLGRERKTWDHLTREGLTALHAEHGAWWKVAKALGMHRMVLTAVRKRLGML